LHNPGHERTRLAKISMTHFSSTIIWLSVIPLRFLGLPLFPRNSCGSQLLC
jgi:hypothetical protein